MSKLRAIRGKLYRPFLTEGERDDFKRMRAAGAISFFRVSECQREECSREVPNSKQYCSVRCYRLAEGLEDDEEDDQGPMD